MKNVIVLSCALLFTSVASAQKTTGMSFVMLPIFTRELPGAFDSVWETTFSAYNAGAQDALYHPLRISFPTDGFPFFPAGAGYRVTGELGGQGSRIFWVERAHLQHFHFSLNFRDRSRQAQSAGIDLPVVRESEFADRITLVNVPIHANFRHSLRIYDAQPAHRVVRVRISEFLGQNQPRTEPTSALAETILTLKGEPTFDDVIWTHAAEEAIHNLTSVYPRLATVSALRIDIDPLEPGAKLWAFVAVTNNQTQEVTTVTPQ